MKARLNPLRADRVERYRYRLSEAEWIEVIGRLATLGFRGLIMGPHGTGKTVFLEDLKTRLERETGRSGPLIALQDGFARRDARCLLQACRNLESGELLFLDGTEWLPPWMRLRVRHWVPKGCGWVATGHRPLAGLPLLWKTEVDFSVALDLVESLLERTTEHAERIEIRRHFEAKAGNIREVIRVLYDRCAEWSCQSLPQGCCSARDLSES